MYQIRSSLLWCLQQIPVSQSIFEVKYDLDVLIRKIGILWTGAQYHLSVSSKDSNGRELQRDMVSCEVEQSVQIPDLWHVTVSNRSLTRAKNLVLHA